MDGLTKPLDGLLGPLGGGAGLKKRTIAPRRGRADDFECPEVFGAFPVPEDAAGYYLCSDGDAALLKCPEGMVFDADIEMCGFDFDAEDEESTALLKRDFK